MAYLDKSTKLYIDGCILNFLKKANKKRYIFAHTVVSEDVGVCNEFKVICNEPKVSSPGSGVILEVSDIEVVSGTFNDDSKKTTYPYGAVYIPNKDKLQFRVIDKEGRKHWYSYTPIV